MRYFRFWLSRHLIHAGLRAMPEGPCKTELYAVIGDWGRHVMATLAARRADLQ